MRKIRISAGGVSVTAALNDTATADAIWKALPLEASGNTWGDEIYFAIPVHVAQEPGASDLVQLGDVAYWPPGHAFCIFFGPTPASRGSECRAASAVNVVGRIEGDARAFKRVPDGAAIQLQALEQGNEALHFQGCNG